MTINTEVHAVMISARDPQSIPYNLLDQVLSQLIGSELGKQIESVDIMRALTLLLCKCMVIFAKKGREQEGYEDLRDIVCKSLDEMHARRGELKEAKAKDTQAEAIWERLKVEDAESKTKH